MYASCDFSNNSSNASSKDVPLSYTISITFDFKFPLLYALIFANSSLFIIGESSLISSQFEGLSSKIFPSGPR